MELKIRLTVLFVLIISFLVIAPYLVFYSLGYRINFKDGGNITATGGIYVHALPAPDKTIIDGITRNPGGLFSSSVFAQNLSPANHQVLIQKDGYYDYQKTLAVKANEVTKLENVILFKQDIPFDLQSDPTIFAKISKEPVNRYVIVSNNLYYYDNAPENASLTQAQKNTPLLKGVLAFKVAGSSIIWLGTDGFLKNTNASNFNSTVELSKVAIKVSLKQAYKIETIGQETFLLVGTNLLMLNPTTQSFANFYSPVTNLLISSDQQKVIYYNDNAIMISLLADNLVSKIQLVNSTDKIANVYWLNNDYIIFSAADKINISEIDYRGNVNVIYLPSNLALSTGDKISVTKPQVFFDQNSKTLYILTNGKLISTNNLLP